MSRQSLSHRAGFAYRAIVVIFAIMAMVVAVVWLMVKQVDWSPTETGPMMHTVARGNFSHEIIERGEIESASNVEVRCEVPSRGQPGTAILWIIPEGTYVKPGDKLVELDSSELEKEQTQQQIACNASASEAVKVKEELEAAEKAEEEYIKGIYPLERSRIKDKIFIAEESKRQAEETSEYTKGLAKRGYVTDLRVRKDTIAVKKSANELATAELELKVLDRFTKSRQLKEFESRKKTAQAALESAKASDLLEQEKLQRINDQIEKCTILAKEPGQVVYAHEDRWGNNNDMFIKEGTLVRDRQMIIRLPDPKRMQVKANIKEAAITMVKKGMPVKIRLDVFPDEELRGSVEKVNEYPASDSWWGSSAKEYQTTIKIISSYHDLKPGLTTEVKIEVESLQKVLQVPVQAIFEHGRQHYCIMGKDNEWRAQKVKIGSTNDKVVVICEGLKQGDQVVLGAFAYRDKVDLPKVTGEK